MGAAGWVLAVCWTDFRKDIMPPPPDFDEGATMDGLAGGMEEAAVGMDGAGAKDPEAADGVEEEVADAENRRGSGIAPLGRNDVRAGTGAGVSKGEAVGGEEEAGGVVGTGRGAGVEVAGLER
jgi:uncharacterized membrane protein